MKKGERYKIRNNTMSGREIVEGIATLIEFVSFVEFVSLDPEGNQIWMVKFDDDNISTFSRVVRPNDKEEANPI